MVRNALIVFLVALSVNLFAQLPDGSVAPDFTLVDYYGTEHHLYSYLDQGKTVIVEIFAAHCSACWNYHQTERLKNLHNNYGPDGTNELMILALEHDPWNGENAFIGDGPPWVTQGNWLEGTPYPIFNVEDPNRFIFDEYNVTGYPVLYKICPDRITERVFTSETENEVYEKVEDCLAALSTADLYSEDQVFFNPNTQSLLVKNLPQLKSIRIFNTMGVEVRRVNNPNTQEINLNGLRPGIYITEISFGNEVLVKKFLFP